jgi:glycosyltransferase involved in cell wall biosynthesis
MFDDMRRLKARLQQNDYDVVQLNISMVKRSLIREFFFCREVLRSGRHRLITVFHGWDPEVANTIARSKMLRFLFAHSFARSDRILVLSAGFARVLEDLGVDSSSIHVLPQAFDDDLLSDFRNLPRNKDKNLLFMSRLIPEKGALELISAFRSGAHEKWPGWTLTIAGDGPERASIESEVLRNSCSDRIRFAGYVRGDEKKRLLEAASVFALPTRYNEGLPISVVEAMSAGCALLCTNVAGLADMVEDNVHGAVIHNGTAEGIGAGLTRLLTDKELLLAAQSNCHSLAWEKLSATSVVAELERHIAEVAG